MADIEYNTPIQNKVFFLPSRSHGIPPKREPRTVPQRAMDIIKVPWNQGEVFQSSFMGKLAPLITTVSNPNKNPAKAAVREILKMRLFMMGWSKYVNLLKKNPDINKRSEMGLLYNRANETV